MEYSVCWTVDREHSCSMPQAATGAVVATVAAETAESPAEVGAAAAIEAVVAIEDTVVAARDKDSRHAAGGSE